MRPTAAWRALLPPYVAVASSTVTLDDGSAHEAELAAAAGMAPGRREEFRTGRTLARTAMAGLGLPPVGVAVGRSREPIWPPGVIGSITHCPGLAAAVVAVEGELHALGIDVEPVEPLPGEVLELVATTAELTALGRLGLPDRLLFAAKEAVFKAWYPAQRSWLDLLDVRIEVDPAGRFAVVATAPRLAGTPAVAWLEGLTGTWAHRGSHLLCAATSSSPSPNSSLTQVVS